MGRPENDSVRVAHIYGKSPLNFNILLFLFRSFVTQLKAAVIALAARVYRVYAR